jgi:hypothetical protein
MFTASETDHQIVKGVDYQISNPTPPLTRPVSADAWKTVVLGSRKKRSCTMAAPICPATSK